MSLWEIVAIALAGLAAGTINTVVGSGTLITFPILLAFGYTPGHGERLQHDRAGPGLDLGGDRLSPRAAGQRGRAIRLGTMSVLGGITGAVLLLVLPASVFKEIVPVFIAIALVLVVLQPRLKALLAEREIDVAHERGILVALAIYGTGVYGGYFGAAQGILLLGILGVTLSQDLHRTNALKNVLAGLTNGVAAVYFMLVAPHVDWGPAGLIAGASILGAQLGARYGRRLPPAALRGLIVVVGVTAIVRLLT